MNPIFQTQRLILKQFTFQDSDFILELLNTEEWIRYIGERNVKTIVQAEEYLTNGPFKSYETHGFGLNLVALKNGQPIGMCGLLKRDFLPHPDLGFAFLPKYMGQGYAFEIAKDTVNHAFTTLKQEKILAITVPENKSSIKLLEKLGFAYDKIITPRDSNEQLMLFGVKATNFTN